MSPSVLRVERDLQKRDHPKVTALVYVVALVRGDRYKHKIKAMGDRSKRSSNYLPNEY